MVKYDSVSVGISVKPESSSRKLKNLLLGLEYKADMADFIITVDDYEGVLMKENGVLIKDNGDHSDNPLFNPKLRGKKVTETFGTLDRIDDYDDDKESVISRTSNDSQSTTRNRPSCRKTRSENRLNLHNNSNNDNNNTDNNTTNRAYLTGQKNNTAKYKSCDYYRRKLYEEGPEPSPEYNEWLNLSTIQKTAGQKVVKKLADQQKILEAEAEQQRKKSLANNHVVIVHSSAHSSNSSQAGSDNESSKANFLPPKKKTTRLEPMQRTVRIAE